MNSDGTRSPSWSTAANDSDISDIVSGPVQTPLTVAQIAGRRRIEFVCELGLEALTNVAPYGHESLANREAITLYFADSIV